MSRSVSIPLDLYRPIVEAVDHETLLPLLLTSRCFRAEAERVLYRSIRYRDSVSFLRTVIDCPRLARLVLEYRCDLYPTIESGHPYYTLFPAALRSLVNLKLLRYGNLTRQPMVHVLRECTFQLVSFYWICHPGDELELSWFLAGQEALETLDISGWNEAIPAPPSYALQKLNRVIGNHTIISAVLPGRNITQLKWYPVFDDLYPDISAILPALCNVRELVFDGYSRRPGLDTIVDHLPNLQFLELVRLHDTDLLTIRRLPRLVILVLSKQWGAAGWLIPVVEEHLDFVTTLFSESATLRFIDIGTNTSGRHQRWCRNSQEPVDVPRFSSLW